MVPDILNECSAFIFKAQKVGNRDRYFMVLPIHGSVESEESQFGNWQKDIGVHLCPEKGHCWMCGERLITIQKPLLLLMG